MSILVPSVLFFLLFAILFCVGSVVISEFRKAPAASALNPTDAGGSQAGLDFLPEVISTLALVPPLAKTHAPPSAPDPLGAVFAMGRGMNDFKSAESVAITIERDKVWLEVNGVNVFRAYNVGIVQVDDRREVSARETK